MIARQTMTSSRRYPIPAQIHRTEEVIRRSRFITTLGYTPTVENARNFISDVNAEFADASHNCWAYVVGEPGSTRQIGMSDAGEPHGTAGKPMLTVLLHSNVGDICAVVTRYFGGTLLGKGGLVKAYSGGVQETLKSLPLAEHMPSVEVEITVDYAAVTPIKRMLPEYEVTVLDEAYSADVTYRLQMPEEHLSQFEANIIELTSGQVLFEHLQRPDSGAGDGADR